MVIVRTVEKLRFDRSVLYLYDLRDKGAARQNFGDMTAAHYYVWNNRRMVKVALSEQALNFRSNIDVDIMFSGVQMCTDCNRAKMIPMEVRVVS